MGRQPGRADGYQANDGEDGSSGSPYGPGAGAHRSVNDQREEQAEYQVDVQTEALGKDAGRHGWGGQERGDAHGLCAELLPELIALDEWGYPILDPNLVPTDLIDHARRAVAARPTLALLLSEER